MRTAAVTAVRICVFNITNKRYFMNYPYTIASLYSGSTGNAVYICAGGAKILIDAGKCTRTLCKSLAEIGVDMSEIDFSDT